MWSMSPPATSAWIASPPARPARSTTGSWSTRRSRSTSNSPGSELPPRPAESDTEIADALDDEATALLAEAHARAGGRAVAPATASKPRINLFNRDTPAIATVTGNFRITHRDASSDVRHIILDFGAVAFPVLEGQSIGIVPPGTDACGQAARDAALLRRQRARRRAAEHQQPRPHRQARRRAARGRHDVPRCGVELPLRPAARREGGGRRPVRRHVPDAGRSRTPTS